MKFAKAILLLAQVNISLYGLFIGEYGLYIGKKGIRSNKGHPIQDMPMKKRLENSV